MYKVAYALFKNFFVATQHLLYILSLGSMTHFMDKSECGQEQKQKNPQNPRLPNLEVIETNKYGAGHHIVFLCRQET